MSHAPMSLYTMESTCGKVEVSATCSGLKIISAPTLILAEIKHTTWKGGGRKDVDTVRNTQLDTLN